MKKLTLSLLPVFALTAACGEEPAPEPAPVEETTAAVEAPVEPSLPAPDEGVFSETFARICPDAEPVNTSVCKRAGMGSEEVICEFGLGDDEYLRNRTILVPGEGEWTFADPETTCATGT